MPTSFPRFPDEETNLNLKERYDSIGRRDHPGISSVVHGDPEDSDYEEAHVLEKSLNNRVNLNTFAIPKWITPVPNALQSSTFISELSTPYCVIREDIARKNAQNMMDRCKFLNVGFRPHVKTHKTIEGALIQTGGKYEKIVVSTVEELQFYINAGFNDIVYGVPISVSRLPFVMYCRAKLGRDVKVCMDHEQQLRLATEYLRKYRSVAEKLDEYKIALKEAKYDVNFWAYEGRKSAMRLSHSRSPGNSRGVHALKPKKYMTMNDFSVFVVELVEGA